MQRSDVFTDVGGRGAEAALRWMLGGLASTTWTVLWIPATAVLAGTALLLGLSRPPNLLLAGQEAAASLSLIMPHAVRLLGGADHRHR